MTVCCPHCAYDLSGQVASWTDQCPLTGRCPECGLGFDWRDQLNPAYPVASRLFEHAQRRQLLAGAWTWLLTFRPSALFSQLRIEHQIVWRRLIPFALCGLVVNYLLFAAARLTVWATAELLWGNGFLTNPNRPAAMGGVLWPVHEPDFTQWYYQRHTTTAWIAVAVLTALAMPLAFHALRFTLPGAQARSSHLCRIALYSAIGLPAVLLCWNGWVEILQVLRALSYKIDTSYSAARDLRWRNVFKWTREHQLVIFAPLFLTWVLLFWSTAASRYLRLDKPLRTTAAILVLSITASLAVFLFLPPGIRYLFAHR
ncbi:MAG: hypothetical protein IT436_08280 [Phycisphaerales bacterium]|nr:hypothetical protein [Phycisphaerales bacterium]